MKRLALTCGIATALFGLCAAISVGALALGFALWSDPCDPSRWKFDHAAWIAEEGRNGMLNDITTNVLVVGDSRAAVLDLLGPPTNAEPDCLRYDTACGDRWWLVVRFDEMGLLRGATIHTY